MKIKIDFITNSSSASFIILKKDLTERQILLIINHIEVAAALDSDKSTDRYYHAWQISEDNDSISGYTSMDNFNMHDFLINDLYINESIIKYEHRQ